MVEGFQNTLPIPSQQWATVAHRAIGHEYHPAGVSAADFGATALTRPAPLAPVHPPPEPAPVSGPVSWDGRRLD